MDYDGDGHGEAGIPIIACSAPARMAAPGFKVSNTSKIVFNVFHLFHSMKLHIMTMKLHCIVVAFLKIFSLIQY